MIEPLSLAGNEAVVDMIDNVYARSGFNGRRLAEAAQLFARMIDEDAVICVTLAGAMTPIGMSGVLVSLIEAGFIDMIVSTGANIYHDLHRPFDCPMYQGHWQVDDNQLADQGVARIYDTFIHDEDTLMATDRVIFSACKGLASRGPVSTARLHYELGLAVDREASSPQKSFVAAAARTETPIYTSSPGDSGIGMNLLVPGIYGQPVQVDPIRDVLETAAIVRAAEKNGAIAIGGGSPKNFYLQTQPTIRQILRDYGPAGHDFYIQLSVDSPHWGGLSGATPQEARSWGKIKDARVDNVVVYSCASITFPLMAQYVLSRSERRTPKRLYGKTQGFVDDLIDYARKNELFRSEYVGMFEPADESRHP
jgi:deoxyhypusine synthase